jgi:hypothetical protein
MISLLQVLLLLLAQTSVHTFPLVSQSSGGVASHKGGILRLEVGVGVARLECGNISSSVSQSSSGVARPKGSRVDGGDISLLSESLSSRLASIFQTSRYKG